MSARYVSHHARRRTIPPFYRSNLGLFSGFCTTVCVCKALLFFLLLSTSVAQELPPFISPHANYIESFLPEDLGTLGALNKNEKELLKDWNDFLDELLVDQEVASLTEAEIHIGAIYMPPQPPAPLGPWVHVRQVDIIRQTGRALTTYSDYDRKVIDRVLLGRPELPWLRRVLYLSHPFSSGFGPIKDPNFYQYYLESFVLR
jgi:hypothetical protein